VSAFRSVWVLTARDMTANPGLAEQLLDEQSAIVALTDGERFLGVITRHPAVCHAALRTLRWQLRIGNLRGLGSVRPRALNQDRAVGAMREVLGEQWWLRPQRCIHCEQLLNLEDDLICSRCRERAANQASSCDPALERAEARGYELGTRLVDQLADQLEREGIRGRELSVAISGAAEALDQRSDMLLAQEDADPT
jgi:hypothetical protein